MSTGPRLGNDCWFLSGPTASGKTTLAIDLARRLAAEIVSVDSMAVYRGLDIGTAKPTPRQRSLAAHHLIDVVPASESYSVARWLADAARAVEDCRARGRRILFVGGTPLYLRSLRDGLAVLPAGDPLFRERLLAEAADGGLAPLHARLAAADPRAADRIHPHDAKRITRALEVIHASGRPLAWITSRARVIRFASWGWMRSAARGSAAASRAWRGARPPSAASASSRSRNNGSPAGRTARPSRSDRR